MTPRAWTNNSGLALNEVNLNALEADVSGRSKRTVIGMRVGAGSSNTIPDSQYFNELHNLEAVMGVEADVTNWYRSISSTSAEEFTATCVPELKQYPNRKLLYTFEIHVNNSQFNKDYAAKNGIYPHVVETLNAIKNSGFADRVLLAPFHEGNGGGGTPGSIGAYPWQMYDTTMATFDGVPNVRLNTPEKYKQAFRNFVTLARSLKVESKIIQWFLAANTSDATLVDGVPRMDMSPGYAGDSYVDIIGLSYYNRSGDSRYSLSWPQPGANGLREFHNAIADMTAKPIWVCESGCATSNQYGNKGLWYSDLVKLVASDELPRVEGLSMFMQDTRKYDANGAVTQGMDMKLENTAQKQMVGLAMAGARRQAKVNVIPELRRNLLPLSVADLTTTSGWVNTSGTTLAVGTQYRPGADSATNGMHITKPPYVQGDDKESHNIFRRVSSSNLDYIPNEPYVLQFSAQASYDGFRLEAGIRQDGGTATSLGDELVLSSVPEQYVVPWASVTSDLGSWRIPNFNFGNNTNTSTAWFRIWDLRLSRGTAPQPNVERLFRPRVKALTNATNLTWNCEAGDIHTVTLAQNSTLMSPTGTPFDGQEIHLRVTQDGVGSRTLNLHSSFYSSTTNPVLATGAGAKTLLKFQYDASSSRWGLVSSSLWNLS